MLRSKQNKFTDVYLINDNNNITITIFIETRLYNTIGK